MQDIEELLQEAMTESVWNNNKVYSAGLPFNSLLYFKSPEISVKQLNLTHMNAASLK